MQRYFLNMLTTLVFLTVSIVGKGQCSFCFLTGPFVSSQQSNCSVIISWSTDTQTSTMSYFSIQRSNNGATNSFVQIGTIPGSPNTSTIIPYSFTDLNPFSTGAALGSKVYYRVKAVRLDGTGQYSNIVLSPTLSSSCSGSFPNPCATSLSLTGNGVVCGTSQTYTLNIGSGTMPPELITWELRAPVVGSGYTLPLQNVCTMTTGYHAATLTKVANGNVVLLAKMNGCQYLSTSKQVTFGVPGMANNGAYSPGNSNQWYTTLTSTVHFTPGTTAAISMANPGNNTYTFTRLSAGSSANSSLVYWSNGNVGVVYTPPVNSNSRINLSVQTSNICGTTSGPLVLYYNGPAVFRMSVSPNPVQDVLTLQLSDESLNEIKREKERINSIEVVNKTGLIVLKKVNVGVEKTIRVDVSQLKSDLYTVVVHYNKGAEQHQISIVK